MYILIAVLLFFLLALLLGRLFIYKMRWSDSRAYRTFAAQSLPLSIHSRKFGTQSLHYIISGNPDLPTMVFIHGSPGSWSRFSKLILDEQLSARFRMVAIDRPGFGHSQFGKALHLKDQCYPILTLIKEIKNDQPLYLFGHSYGGPVVTQLAAMEPTLFKGVIIVAGAIDPDLEKKEIWRIVMGQRPIDWLIPGAYQPSNRELLLLKKDLQELENELDKITCPVIFIHGDADKVVPIENVDYGRRLMKNAASITVHVIKGARHGVHREKTEEVKRILFGLSEGIKTQIP